MAKQIRCGMVGGALGAFIGDVHRKAANFDTRLELVAGCFSTRAEKNAETGDACCIAPDRLYADYKEMAAKGSAREDGIDFVTIVTPNYNHYETAKAFLEAGINVICEKPLCFEVAQAEELEALAKENLSVWRKDPKYSGVSNCVGDIGTHIECFVHYVTGLKIKRLAATTNKYGHALDLSANMLIEYEGGVNGAYWCSQIAAGHYNGLVVRVFGELGSLEWTQEHPDFLNYTPKGGAARVLTRTGNETDYPGGGNGRLPVGHPEGLYIS